MREEGKKAGREGGRQADRYMSSALPFWNLVCILIISLSLLSLILSVSLSLVIFLHNRRKGYLKIYFRFTEQELRSPFIILKVVETFYIALKKKKDKSSFYWETFH